MTERPGPPLRTGPEGAAASVPQNHGRAVLRHESPGKDTQARRDAASLEAMGPAGHQIQSSQVSATAAWASVSSADSGSVE